ncbi:MAG: hypothetical protein Kow001_20150 [Acidobacteriota bacterium]
MFIEKSLLFQGLPEDFVTGVEAAMSEENYGEGAFVFRRGEPAEKVYILEEGRIRLMVGELGSVTRTVRKPGDVFGWSSLLGPGGYTATAQCLTACRVRSIQGRRLNQMLEESPALGLEFFRRVAALIRQRLIDSYRILMTYESEKRPHSYG